MGNGSLIGTIVCVAIIVLLVVACLKAGSDDDDYAGRG